jgi:hypothetical protein
LHPFFLLSLPAYLLPLMSEGLFRDSNGDLFNCLGPLYK